MTVERSTDASTTPPPLSWETIDWPHIRQEVRRLQMRIAKATQAERHRKAEALQWLLTHSRAATRIERHIKVKGQAQPYDPQYTKYFEQRRCFAWRVR